MGKFERFYPDYSYKCVGDIEPDFFKNNNIKYAVLDIDNTLVPYTVKTPDKTAFDFLKRLDSEGVVYCFLSNNSANRVEIFNENIGAVFVSNAKKPLLSGMKKVIELMDANPKETVLIGDQVFTDVLTGKRAGVKTILVLPIEDKETLFFKFKRAMEKIVLKGYGKGF